MSNDAAADRQRRPGGGKKLRLLSLCVLLVGAAFYFRDLLHNLDLTHPRSLAPMAPIQLPAELSSIADLGVSPGSAAGRNVILVTLDTTRPDRIRLYGNQTIETPTLDRLGREGVVFSEAVAVVPATLPAHASILTGLYPYGHGARANGVFTADVKHPTLAEILAAHGYDTAAFVSSFALDAQFGLARGFGVYDDKMYRRRNSIGFSERRADETTERAVGWLKRPPKEPFFLWVHYYDPHTKYDPPEPYASRSANPYDGEISFMDAQLGRLLEAAKAAGGREPLIVVLADHGEALGEHGEDTHSYLVQEATIRIPLILHAPGVLPSASRIDSRASQVDVVPTVLSLLGIDAPAGLHGIDWTRAPDPDREVLAESLEGRTNFGWRRLSALYFRNLKLVSGARRELYDLARDPIESRDIAAENPGVVAQLEQRLEAQHEREPKILHPDTGALGDATTQRLAALGYIVTDAQTMSAGGPGPDPRDMMIPMRRVMRAIDAPANAEAYSSFIRFVAKAQGLELPRTDEELIAVLEKFAESDPDFAPTLYFLSIAYTQAGRPDDASRTLERLEAVKRAAANEG